MILFAVEEKMDFLLDHLKALTTGQKKAGPQVEKQLLILLLLLFFPLSFEICLKKIGGVVMNRALN